MTRSRAGRGVRRAAALALGLAAAVLAGPVRGAPIVPIHAVVTPPDLLNADLALFTLSLATATPRVPSGSGKALGATTLDAVAAGASAAEGFITARPLAGGVYPGREIAPRPGEIRIPLLSEPRQPVVMAGRGALRVDEVAPESIRYRDPATGVVTEYVTYGKLASAGTGAGQVDDMAKQGVLVGSTAEWAALRDGDPDDLAEQSGLLQVAMGGYFRSANGPLYSGATATLSELGVAGFARGRTALAPELDFHVLSNFGLPDRPKRDRELHAAFVLEGLVSFLASPLWSLEIELVPDGSVLTRFTGSDALRAGDGSGGALDAAAVERAVRERLHLDASGMPSTPGSLDFEARELFSAVIDSPRRFDYTQRVVTYLEVGIPEPGTAALAIAALVAAAAIQARVQRRRRS